MSRIRFVSVSVLVLTVLAGVAVAGGLDGKTFVVSMAAPGEDPTEDTLIFADGTFDSVGCREYGFGEAPYEAEKKGDGWTFTSTTTSEEEGVAHWKGTVKGDTLSGTMEWVKPGQDAITYKFSGKLKS